VVGVRKQEALDLERDKIDTPLEVQAVGACKVVSVDGPEVVEVHVGRVISLNIRKEPLSMI
jgi:hypothetical protein